MQKKSAKKRAQNRKETKLIKDRILERMGESDWDQMIDNLIARATDDTKSFETLRDTIGQKPVEKVVEVKEEKTEANEEQIIPAVFSAEEMNVQNDAEVLETPKPKRTRKKKVVEEPQDENIPVVETENNEEKTENDG
jgi:Mn-containing catalase